jgi:XRE family transcriptional regulator, fatty acid utilization regulator
MRLRLKEVRLLRGLSQDDLSRASGVSISNVNRIETGKQQPRPSTLRRLAAALDVDVMELWETDEGKLAA